MATASLLSSSFFISKPPSPSSLFFHLPVKQFVSSSAQFRQRYGAVVSATSVATEPAETPSVTQNGKVEQAQMTSETEKVVLPTNESNEQLLRIRHTCAHVMAMAVQKLYPDAKVTIGPWIENGFYYDFDMEPLTDKDLKRIKKEMDRIIGRNLPLVREEVSRDEAKSRIMAIKEPYKMEILESIIEDPITIYHIGEEWWDLCAGPHVETTGKINKKAVELESVAGAYWRGDEKKPMLQRIYGTAWENEEQLKAYLHFKEEAKRRDHRRLGQDLDLFSIQDEAGGGLVFWHPKGSIVRHIIEDFWKKSHIEHGYDLLYTPHVAKADLWKISGHLDFYRENMYDQMNIEDELYQLRPMNCPYHILVYQRKLQSYRDFPIRVAELGTVYRYELSGSLHGLFRVRGFTQDDAHIFCLEDQIKDEIRAVLDLTEEILLQFGFNKYEVNLSTKPEKAVGGNDIWEKATSALRDALDDKGWDYQIDEGGEKKRPIMIHRAVLGSLERFFGVLIEHYAGDFPLWLSPIQARVLPVTDTQLEYCNEVIKKLKTNGIRAEICHGERLPKLIRNAEKQKIPLMAVVGAKEVDAQTVTVRSRPQKQRPQKVLTVVRQPEPDAARSQGAVFYVLSMEQRPMATQMIAIASAWKEACTSENLSTVVISKGNYMVGSVTFKGPCKSPITLHIEGKLKAPVELERLSSQDGWIVFQDIDGLQVSGGGTFDGQGSAAWAKNDCRKTGKCSSLPINLRFSSVTNSKMQDVTSLNSKLFHINILNCKNLSLQHISINAPANSLNTAGIHIGRSNGVHITDADIKTGDDCVSLGDGSQQISIEKVTCGPGHGISVDTLGRYHDEQPVNGVTVRNCTLKNTMNGVRVKTWPDSPSGVASEMTFEDIIMDNAPSRVRISNVNFNNISGTSVTHLAGEACL
ncbi:threonine--tRNA ligase 2 [Citrus sinensis]|nr:threonine--tRNA ligase 2 [Citrus sinensis]